MLTYGIDEWIGFFIIYCFIGWVGESIYVSIEHHKIVNRGFLHGPFLPIYGSGAIIILFATLPVRNNLFLIFLFGMLSSTVLEYFTGYIMEQIFHVKYWDYTCQPFNLNGYICLGCSLTWGLLAMLLTRVVHRPIENFLFSINSSVVIVVDAVFTIYFIWDIVVSAQEAFDLKRMILANEEIQRLSKRIDVFVAFAEDDKAKLESAINEAKQEVDFKIDMVKNELQYKVNRIKKGTELKYAFGKAECEAELSRLKAEITATKEKWELYKDKKQNKAYSILKRNPGATSKKHEFSFDVVRNLFVTKITKK